MRAALLLPLALPAVLWACSDRAEKRPLSEAEVKQELAQLKLQPGEWETRTEVKSISAPRAAVPADALAGAKQAQTFRTCLTRDQAANPDPGFVSGTRNAGCQAERLDMGGGKIAGRVTCRPQGLPGKATSELSGTYTRTAFQTDVKSRVDLTGLPDIALDVTVISRRVGDCSGAST